MNFVGSANVAATIVVFELACSQEQEKKRRLISSASEALFGEIFGSKSFSLLQILQRGSSRFGTSSLMIRSCTTVKDIHIWRKNVVDRATGLKKLLT